MAVDYFLNLGTVEGESADHKHKGEIDLQSWSFGATNAGSFSMGGGGGAGKVSMQDFHFANTSRKLFSYRERPELSNRNFSRSQ